MAAHLTYTLLRRTSFELASLAIVEHLLVCLKRLDEGIIVLSHVMQLHSEPMDFDGTAYQLTFDLFGGTARLLIKLSNLMLKQVD